MYTPCGYGHFTVQTNRGTLHEVERSSYINIILLHLGNSMDYCNALEIIHTYGLFCLLFHPRTFLVFRSHPSFFPMHRYAHPRPRVLFHCMLSIITHPPHCPQRLTIAFHFLTLILVFDPLELPFRAYHPPFLIRQYVLI